MDAVLAGLIAGGSNYAALIGPPSHDYGLPTQFRPLEQLDRDKESVHVDVENRRGRPGLLLDWAMLRAEPCQVRHAGRVRPIGECDNSLAIPRQVRSAAITRGIPARSLVTPMLVQFVGSRRGWTAARLPWPSSRTKIPPVLRHEA